MTPTWEQGGYYGGKWVVGIQLEPMESVTAQGKTEAEAKEKAIKMAEREGYDVEHLKEQRELF